MLAEKKLYYDAPNQVSPPGSIRESLRLLGRCFLPKRWSTMGPGVGMFPVANAAWEYACCNETSAPTSVLCA
jgi:hypothetical protein